MLSICRELISNRIGRESWLMVLLVSGSQSFLVCHREVCWVLFSSFFIPVKCLSLWRTDYMPILITPHYWQLFACQQTDLLLLLNRDLAWIQVWSNHWCMILNPNKTNAFWVSRTRTVNHPHGDLVLSKGFHLS